jgi:heme/copper-type cytochrome/quinol oxidase subunit 2
MNRDAIDATAATLGTKAAYTGATTTVGSWLLSSEFGVIAGLFVGVIGLLTNLYFQHRRDKREQRAHELEEIEHARRMERMNSQRGELR